jgi:hypothetical protein
MLAVVMYFIVTGCGPPTFSCIDVG